MTTTPGQRERAKRAATEALAREMTLAMLGRRGETQDEQYRAMADAAIDAYESALAEQPREDHRGDYNGPSWPCANCSHPQRTHIPNPDAPGGTRGCNEIGCECPRYAAQKDIWGDEQPRGDEERLREALTEIERYVRKEGGDPRVVDDMVQNALAGKAVVDEFGPLASPTDEEER